ncbi:MFS transporter [Bradyrhizobium sp. WD16]|uniref:MFS transporter n=1 Tax=Bradyrhizobium sp. WD16 TaxID=1521768 RepID=UPI0020A24A8B|nr:MFS transporter [Bradyrhizobium sp. WD16]UTD27619.1 MFS transporter [Bradyrhizobium sp. WD16]
MVSDAPRTAPRWRDVPRGVWALGFVSMLMDISSEMIHALLPVYLTTVLGLSVLTVGFIEGIAESTAMITRIFSGALSDWLGRRKLLAALGYGLAAFTKPVFPLATTAAWFVAARFVDRIGKGIRGAPRDALVADLSPPQERGASFGLRQSLDTVGAFIGPLLAVGLMLWTLDSYRTVFWIAVVPAFASLLLITVGVEEPRGHEGRPRQRLRFADAGRLGARFWIVVGIAVILTLARFSEAFLVLRAQRAGLSVAMVPLIMVVMNVVYALAAYPAGVLSDRIGRGGVLIAGTACLVAADLVFALGTSVPAAMVGVAVWGLHMGLTQGLLAALVADTAPVDLRGTAFGVYSLAAGIATLISSIIAGALWDEFGPAATFFAGAGFTALALLGLSIMRETWRRPGAVAGPPKS